MICSKHFVEQDYQTISCDTNKSRQKLKHVKTLKKHSLKATAIPSLLPDCPSYLSKNHPPERKTTVHAEKRRERAQKEQEKAIKEYFDEHKVTSFGELKQKMNNIILPSGVSIIIQKEAIQFIALQNNSFNVPEVAFSLTVCEDLKFIMALNGIKASIKTLAHLFHARDVNKCK